MLRNHSAWIHLTAAKDGRHFGGDQCIVGRDLASFNHVVKHEFESLDAGVADHGDCHFWLSCDITATNEIEGFVLCLGNLMIL